MSGAGLAGIFTLLGVSLLGGCQRNRTGVANACPLSDADYTRQIAAARDWDALYSLYKIDAPRCPTATDQADYSRRLLWLLTQQWQKAPAFDQAAQRDPGLASFVYGHINDKADPALLRQLLEEARSHCPAGASAFCEQLAWRTQAALIAQGLSN